MGMAKHMKTCSAGNAVTLFKESHIAIKRAVVDVAGEQQVDAHWVCALDAEAFAFHVRSTDATRHTCCDADPHRCHD